MSEQTTERWRPVIDWEGFYEVSDLGRVRHAKTKRIRTPVPNNARGGYFGILLSAPGRKPQLRFVHRMVLDAFVGPKPDDQQARHGDRDVSNNRLENLCWGTPKENCADQRAHGTIAIGEKNGGAKLSQAQADNIRIRLSSGEMGENLALEYGVSRATISRIKNGLRYVS